LNNSTACLLLQLILERTKEGSAVSDEVKEGLVITKDAFNEIMENLKQEGLINWDGSQIQASLEQRIELSVRAIQLGADFEKISNSLGWKEFEELVARVFRENGYNTKSRYRFQAEGRRWEIDVLATSYPYIVCAECKHYTTGMGNGTARTIIEMHIEKTEVMSQHIGELAKKIGVQQWKDAILVPITLTLKSTKMSFYRRVPSVSVFMLPSFLSEFPGYMERMTYFHVDIPKFVPKPKQLKLRR
jgi:hypothetical protein